MSWKVVSHLYYMGEYNIDQIRKIVKASGQKWNKFKIKYLIDSLIFFTNIFFLSICNYINVKTN